MEIFHKKFFTHMQTARGDLLKKKKNIMNLFACLLVDTAHKKHKDMTFCLAFVVGLTPNNP